MTKIYSVIDIETTGTFKKGAKITEIAIINFDGEKIIDEYSTLINPEQRIPWNITKLTGITNEMVEDAPKFYEVAKKIVEMTEGNVFIAHNVFFDFNFIKHEFSELGYSFQREKLCTVRMARQFLPGHKSYSLGRICQDLGIKIEGRHRAMGDAKATVELLRRIISNKSDALDTERVQEKGKVSIPTYLDRKVYESLPHVPGVYYFYSRSGELIYVGKSKDIKKRVGQHFRVDMKRRKDIDLKNQIAHIDYKILGNELAALLYECHEIKYCKPAYNTSMKRTRFPVALRLEESEGIKEIKAYYRSEDEEVDFAYTTMRRAQKRRDNIYKSLLGTPKRSVTFDRALKKLIKTVGIDAYNEMIEKTFTKYKRPQESFQLELSGRNAKEVCLIEVELGHPKEIIYVSKDGEINECLKLDSDQDMRNILFNFVSANEVKSLPTSEPHCEESYFDQTIS